MGRKYHGYHTKYFLAEFKNGQSYTIDQIVTDVKAWWVLKYKPGIKRRNQARRGKTEKVNNKSDVNLFQST